MDTKELRKLVEFISRSDFTEFEMEQEGFRLRLSRVSAATPPPPAVATAPVAAPVPPESVPLSAAPEPTAVPAAEKDNGLLDVRSPIVGTFYRSPNPEAAAFVGVGDHVEIGQTLCIVEAMKLMNEIQAEVAGEIVEVLPANAQPVEYDEVLFRVRPTA